MTWTRAQRPAAEIIRFPSERVKERKSVVIDGGARVLLYTGVRYERRLGDKPDWHGDDHRPRRGGRRSGGMGMSSSGS